MPKMKTNSGSKKEILLLPEQVKIKKKARFS